jgi:predicted amidohydrolase YtcJ
MAIAALALFPAIIRAQKADLVIHNANVYTVDKAKPKASAIAVSADRIVYVGDDKGVSAFTGKGTQVIDAGGKFVMPGLIEGHGHIYSMGFGLTELNLMHAKNWDEIVAMVADAVRKAKPGDWIVGNGWHQEKWDHAPARNHLGYPYHEELDKVSPDNPVMLSHASGHSTYVNAKAMQLSGITDKTPSPNGGDIVRDAQGNTVGVLTETAQEMVGKAYGLWYNQRSMEQRKAVWRNAIRLAEAECLRNGVTSFEDAGSGFEDVAWMRELARENKLHIRFWLMVSAGIKSLEQNQAIFPIIDEGDRHLTVKAIKCVLDGALGSYGAWFLEPYTDRPDTKGLNTFSIDELRQIASFAWAHQLQLCVHAIGDRANRETVNIFAGQISTDSTRDHRWRVEHAQHVHPAEIPRFARYHIIASMQGIHCTSDAPFVVRRLGEERARDGAYVWRSFMDAGVLVNNGTDVPVEDIDPFACLYASVTRKTKDGTTFYPGQVMTREEAIYSYTMANARAAFQEKDKGSIEKGKLADIIMLSNDLISCPADAIRSTKVLMTMVGGKIEYQTKN